MSAVEDRPDDQGSGPSNLPYFTNPDPEKARRDRVTMTRLRERFRDPRDVVMCTEKGPRRGVLKTVDSINAARAILCAVYECPDRWLEEVLRVRMKFLDGE